MTRHLEKQISLAFVVGKAMNAGTVFDHAERMKEKAWKMSKDE